MASAGTSFFRLKLGKPKRVDARVRRPQYLCASDFESLRWSENVSEATLPALGLVLRLEIACCHSRRGRRTGSRALDLAAIGLLCSAGRTETKNLAAISQRTPHLASTVRVA